MLCLSSSVFFSLFLRICSLQHKLRSSHISRYLTFVFCSNVLRRRLGLDRQVEIIVKYINLFQWDEHQKLMFRKSNLSLFSLEGDYCSLITVLYNKQLFPLMMRSYLKYWWLLKRLYTQKLRLGYYEYGVCT